MTGKKEEILQAARQMFSEKGYDATGMEEIAAKTGSPKSLIYYHFKNKKELLDTIISDFMGEYSQILHDGTLGIDKIKVYIDFLKSNQDCARILLSESLKGSHGSELLFNALAPLMAREEGTADGKQADHAHWVAEFFTSTAPTILLACYEDSWCGHFGVTQEQLEQDYVRAYQLTHGAYHRFIEKESF